MKRVLATLSLAVILAAFLTACGGSGGKGESTQLFAGKIQDGAEKYDRMQLECPVCGGRPISPDYHSDVNGKRIYFDDSDCKQEFDQNPQKYIQDYTPYAKQRQKSTQQSLEKQRSGK